ncbi:MAG: DUF1631 domain-containing protein [Rhodanobacteraceae bacterium]
MSEDPAKSKVVNLGQQGVTEERGGELLHAVDRVAVKRIRELAGSLFENVDDALFDLAEKAESNAVQTRYFDGMREVRRKRQLIERLFIDNCHGSFKQFANGKLPAPATTDTGDSGSRDGELSLVEETELEESLAVTSMISKAENRYARLLYSVNQRLAVISGGSKVVDANNPLGPACLCDCFRRAMQELEADVNVKLIIYKLFERYVLADLETLYNAVNTELIRAGVLPQLRHQVSRGKKSARRAMPTASGDEYVAAGDQYAYSEEEEEMREQLYATVNQMLSQRRHVSRPGYARGAAAAGPALDMRELVSALALLQQQAPPVPADLSGLDSAHAGSLTLEELKNALQGQIAKVSSDAKARVSGADEDTIDLVGMLFEYILEDRNLPTQMQALLGRLQIPYLKVAILDKHLFAKHSHPARRLLDRLADAAKSWSKESDRDLRLFNEIKSIVTTLLHDFDDDTDIFKNLLNRFNSFVNTSDMRAERAEKRASDAAKGKEKLQAARRTAAREILSRSQNAQVPDLIRNILTRPWANYLVLTLLRQGEDSPEWRSAKRFIDDLISSAQPPTNDEQRAKIRQMLPGIEKSLRHGLSTVAFSDSDVRRLMRALGRFYHGQLGEPGDENVMDKQAEEAASEPVIPESVEEIAEPEEIVEPAAPEVAPDSPMLQAAKALKVGNWVEFIDDNGQRDRAKLSWISPISGKYLFVNRRGLKVCDLTLNALAASIHDGSTVVLEEVPLFDRALDAIVERLKNDQSDAKQSAAPKAAAEGAANAPQTPSTPKAQAAHRDADKPQPGSGGNPAT